MKLKIRSLPLTFLLAIFIVIPAICLAASVTFTASETASNGALGTDNQTAATAATTANVSEVKATRTLTVGSLPVTTETIIVGTCTVTFATTTAGSPAEDANCTGNATILTTTGTGSDIARTVAQIATALRTLTNVSDTGHGALTVSGSGSDVIFTTTNTEASATAITFTDGTGGNITSTASTVGVVPVAQVNTITIGGTVETGDVFTATLPTVGAVTYTVTSSDTTTANIATGLNAAIQASSGYASQAFTSAASSNTVVLTAKTAGTGFTQTSGTTNVSAIAQTVTFTPSAAKKGYTYTITINGEDYDYVGSSDDTIQDLVEALQALVDADSAVSCTENNVIVTCTAASAGTSFTYDTDVDAPNMQGSSSRLYYPQVEVYVTPQVTPDVPTQSPSAILGGASSIGRSLYFGVTGEDVTIVQQLLARDPNVYPEGLVTGYFGPLTDGAVKRFQIKYSVATEDDPGYGWVGPRTRAKLIEIYGE